MGLLHRATVLAQQEAAGIEIILPPKAELVWGAIAFAVFYWVMSKYAFPRINTVLEERAAAIQGRMEEAETRLQEAERIRREYREQLDGARAESNRIIEEARQTAESLRREIVAKAEAEAETIVERAQAEVATERERAVQQLRAEVGRLSVQLAERIVGKELDERSHQALIDSYIDRLAGTNGTGPGRA